MAAPRPAVCVRTSQESFDAPFPADARRDQGRLYPDFERGWRTAEVAGRAVMLLAVCATVAGLLGGGPVSIWTRHAKAGALEVEYSPVVRFGTPTGLTLRAAPAPGQDRVAVTLPASIVQRYGLQAVLPQPVEWGAGEAGLRMTFAVPPDASATTIQVGGMPSSGGVMRLSARLDDGPAVRWSQLVLP